MAISKIILNGVTQMDATPATAGAADIMAPKTAMLADGVLTTGTGSGGGGVTPAEQKDVNFIDYDGTIVYSYTKAEFANLSALPANPTHDGLTAQGWNWSLSDAKTYVASYGKLWIGQMYVTSDGKTRIYIHLEEGRLSPYLGIAVNGTVDVDWGDGSTHSTVTGTSLSSQKRTLHEYSTAGSYTITISVVSGSFAFYGTSTYTVLSKNSSTAAQNNAYAAVVRAVRIGSNALIRNYAFSMCRNMTYITCPVGVGSYAYAFNNCAKLFSITIPSGETSTGGNTSAETNGYAFNYCYGLTRISLPSSLTVINTSSFTACYLPEITMPPNIDGIGSYAFANSYCLSSLVLPSSLTSITASAVSSCISLQNIKIPSGVTSIAAGAFSACVGLGEIHFMPTTPPTVANVNAFNSLPTDCIIYVPYSADHSVLAAYQAATNYPDPNTYTYMEEAA